MTRIEGGPWSVDAAVEGTRKYAVAIRRIDNTFEVSCDCPYFQDRLAACKHIWAALLAAEHNGLLIGDGAAPAAATLEPIDIDAWTDPEFRTSAPPVRRGPREPGAGQWERFLGEFSRQLTETDAARRPPRYANAQLAYVIDRGATMAGNGLALDLQVRQRRKNGEWERPKAASIAIDEIRDFPDPADREDPERGAEV